MNILAELKTRFPFYLMGKTSRVIDAAIYYLENDISQRVAAKKFECSECIVRERANEMRNMLNITKKRMIPLYGSCMICGSRLTLSAKNHYNVSDSQTNKRVAKICSLCMKQYGGA